MNKTLIPQERNFASLGQLSRQSKKPIVLYVSSSTCDFCIALDAQVFNPTFKNGGYEDLLFSKVMLDDEQEIHNFSGQKILPLQFVRENLGMEFTPSLYFVDHQGKQLAKPLIGVANLEYYEYLMLRQVKKAQQLLNNKTYTDST